ncbi:hypothetical protein [Moraxella lacunata]|uniref:hypothetical protein n=1 Tax=Moraxella lacunata TaxID=477 RepID=UPI003EE23703
MHLCYPSHLLPVATNLARQQIQPPAMSLPRPMFKPPITTCLYIVLGQCQTMPLMV